MKLHELDWQEVLRELPRWNALSPLARRAFIDIRPGQSFPLPPLGPAGAELKAAGLLVAPTGRGTNYALRPELRPLLVALRAADRLHPLHRPDGRVREEYLQDQIDVLQSHRIAAPDRGYAASGDRKRAADAVSSSSWVRGFLAAESQPDVNRWEEQRLTGRDTRRLAFPAVAETLRALVQALAAHPFGVPLRAVHALVPQAAPGDLAAALAAGLRYLLVFVSVGPALEAEVGLLPAVAARMGPPPAPPQPVEAGSLFAAPFRIGDMTALLVEAATEPIAIRASDGSLYVRAQRAISARLASLPQWVDRFTLTGDAGGGAPEEDEDDGEAEADEAADRRVEWAVHFARMLRLASLKSTGSRARLEATREGRAWLAGSEGERLRQVLAALRALKERVPSAYGSSGELGFFGQPLGFELEARNPPDVRAALAGAFLSVPPGAQVSYAAFMRYHARAGNPFLGAKGPAVRARSYWGTEPATEEGWEDAWAGVMLGFLARRLVPLGGAALGRAADGSLTFGVTDAGRYLLGGRDDFELAPEAAGGEVVVQPDFEIVFLAPAPRAEAELGRIAERTGSGVGALFRLTRASVLRAAEQGMTAAQLLKALESVARGGVPANVARQVADWMKAVRTVRIAPAVLIDCPDAETAGRVRALGGAQVTEVTPTLLRLEADAKARAAFVKRLRDKGIFVAAEGAANPKPAEPARRRGSRG